MNLLHLRYFAELAQTLHYTRAAEHLCIAQPSLSHAISQMEAELGVPLFEKVGKSIVLTHYGEQFLACAQQTLMTLDNGVDALQRVGRGEGLIRLGLLRTLGEYFVPGLAERFLKQYPENNIRFTFNTGTTGQLLDGLCARRFDLVFASLAQFHTIDLAQTIPYPQVYFAKGSGLRSVVDGLFLQIGQEPQIAYETEEDSVIAGLVAHGFGIAVVPYMEMLLRLL